MGTNGNALDRCGRLGERVLEMCLDRDISLVEGHQRLISDGHEISYNNFKNIIGRKRDMINRRATRIKHVLVPPTLSETRKVLEETKANLTDDTNGSTTDIINVKPRKIINKALADLELLKIKITDDSRYYLATLKLQTDIAIALIKTVDDRDEIDPSAIMQSFDWLSEFVNLLDKKYEDLNIKKEYLEYIEKKSKQ